MKSKKTTETKKTTDAKAHKSVENGLKIIKKALKENISLSESSRRFNFGRNYVSDVKARITNIYKKKNVSKELYNEFKTLIKEYTKR